MRYLIQKVFKHFKWLFLYNSYLLKNKGDEDWDFSYLYSLLRWKLNRMADCIDSNAIVASHKRIGKQLKYAVRLIDLLETDELRKKQKIVFEVKWGKPTIYQRRNENVDGFVPEKERNKAIFFTFDKVFNEKDWYAAKKQWYEDRINLEKQMGAIKLRLFKHIATYIDGWWD